MALASLLLATSCVMHEHVVGLGPTGNDEKSTRQYYLFFGLVRLNETNVQRMAGDLTSYSIETEFSFTDLLLFPFLLPLTMTSRTVTVRT
jgi:hypothetical protein